ncbi:MAG: undecaprenyl-diphosphate phosphatase [Candidatus Eremiobacterota bacterium]
MLAEHIQALVLGVVQGVTEFLPVSSSAHLLLLPRVVGWEHFGKTFDVALHGGTLLALAVFYRADLWMLARGGGLTWRDAEPPAARHLAGLLVRASLPAALLGFLLEDWLEANFQGPRWLAVWLALGAVAMLWADRRPQKRSMWQLSGSESQAAGWAQALALMPGVSRSGATLVACRAMGLTRPEAMRFSMLMAFPVVAGATAWKLLKLWLLKQSVCWSLIALGTVAAAASGLWALSLLARHLPRLGLAPFALYRLALAGLLWTFVR